MTTQTIVQMSTGDKQDKTPALRPLALAQSLFYFAVPAAGTFVSYHLLRPWLERLGYDSLTSYLAALCIPVALLFAAALVSYHTVENQPLTWPAFSKRMRFPRLRMKDWGASLLIFLVGMLGYGVISRGLLVLIETGWVPLPGSLPVLADPRAVFSIDALNQSAGGMIHGRWDIAALFLVTFFFNIAGEELWWRGIILPRQIMALGRWAWPVHGLLWMGFHAFKWWDMLALLPVCLLIAYSAQKMKSNWPALIAHAMMNGTGLVLVLLAVVGK
jgi:membrane protease YdiL (CAAX protease family)